MNLISNVLYWISTGLLVPVIVLLIFFFIRAFILIGGFFGEYLMMKKTSSTLLDRIKNLTPATVGEFSASLPQKTSSEAGAYARLLLDNRGNEAKRELLLSEYEIAVDKKLSTPRMLTKMGPILGLMGTLIPMGPALVGLATGDIASMAYNMQVAFATTVVGLVISAIGFISQQVKERWYVKTLAMLEYLSRVINQSESKKAEI